VVWYFNYRDILSGNMLPKINIHILLIIDPTMSVLVSLELGFHFMTYTGMLDMDQRSVLMSVAINVREGGGLPKN
jgi:hypothetical protein